MKKLIIAFLFSGLLFAQGVHFSAGYTQFKLTDVKSQFRNMVRNFSANVGQESIPIQTLFPGNYYFSAGVDLVTTDNFRFGVEIGSGRTNAIAQYSDVQKKIEVNGALKTAQLGISAEGKIFSNSNNSIYAGAIIGFCPLEYSLKATVFDNQQYPQERMRYSESVPDILVYIEPQLIYERSLFLHVSVNAHIGYRFGKSFRPPIDEITPGNDFVNTYLAIPSIDADGYLVMIGISYRW